MSSLTPSRRPITKKTAKKPRHRLKPEDREQQILQGAIKFFSERGLEGQTRDLAQEIGITHPLLYHYFPTKRALIERVYQTVYLGRWKVDWEECLDNKSLSLQEKLTQYYLDYVNSILTPEWVRILLSSGLSDGYIPERYFALLSQKLFPRIVRETRRHLGLSTRTKVSERENELVWGMHGGIFYLGIRCWVYQLNKPENWEQVIRDRVRAYVVAAEDLFGPGRKS